MLLDTSTLLAYLGNETNTRAAARVIDGLVRTGRNTAVVSTVSAMELLVRPRRAARADVERAILGFLVGFPNLALVPVDLTVARVAAAIRAAHGLRPPDALIVATGLDRSAAFALSDDSGWPDAFEHAGRTMRVLALASLSLL